MNPTARRGAKQAHILCGEQTKQGTGITGMLVAATCGRDRQAAIVGADSYDTMNSGRHMVARAAKLPTTRVQNILGFREGEK
jgi:hypothetical protein